MYDPGQFIMISQESTGTPETGPTAFSFRGVLHFFIDILLLTAPKSASPTSRGPGSQNHGVDSGPDAAIRFLWYSGSMAGG